MKKELLEDLLRRAKEISDLDDKEGKRFYEKYILTSKDEVSLVLKSHLYLEFTIDRILSLILPKPAAILKMRFTDKVNILESLNSLPVDKIVIEKIRAINIVRNNFSHQLDYHLTATDLKRYFRISKGNNESTMKIFLKEVRYIHGYMGATIGLLTLFPFLMNSIRNKEMFKEDKTFDLSKMIDLNEKEEMIKVIEAMKKK